MTGTRQVPPIDERDFDAIEAAVMETERGRWFLGEFARRNRQAETRLLLDAMTRLEQSVAGPATAEDSDRVRAALSRIAASLSGAVQGAGSSQDGPSEDGLDGLVAAIGTAEAAIADIHAGAERVSETAWRLREAGASGSLCTELEKAAADISTACAFGGLTAGRAKRLAQALREIGQHLETLPPGWVPSRNPPARRPGGPEHRAPAPSERPPPRGEVARPAPPARTDAPSARPPSPAEPARRAPPPVRMPAPSLEAISRLDLKERLKLFT